VGWESPQQRLCPTHIQGQKKMKKVKAFMVSLLLMAGLSFVSCSDDGDGGSAGWNTGGSSLVLLCPATK